MRISIVYAVRDPDYGDGLIRRTQTSMNHLVELGRHYGLDFELVVVEWNPPPEKKRIRELVTWPANASGKLRFIEVPLSAHEQFENSDRMPFFEYIAKNVGIRRSRGDWVLASSADVLFNDRLTKFLARGRLDRRAFYRIDRHDVAAELPVGQDWERRLAICRENVVAIHSRGVSLPGPEHEPSLLEKVGAGIAYEFRLRVGASRSPRESEPHTNASGDFLLMSRDNWFRLRGYAEIPTHAHIDSIMCWSAASAGLREVVLDAGMRLYHQEHDRSSQHDFPVTDWIPWHEKYKAARRSEQEMIPNTGAWGLPDASLTEYVI